MAATGDLRQPRPQRLRRSTCRSTRRRWPTASRSRWPSPGCRKCCTASWDWHREPANLLLTLNGTQIAVEKAGDRLRFYAPAAGDRWNATSAYWLTLDEGPAIAQRGPGNGRPRGRRVRRGEVAGQPDLRDGLPRRRRRSLVPQEAGSPCDLYRRAADVTQSVPVTVPVQTTLPLRSGSSTFAIVATDVAGFSHGCDKPYLYYVQGAAGGSVVDTQDVSWTAAPSCIKQATGTATLTLRRSRSTACACA